MHLPKLTLTHKNYDYKNQYLNNPLIKDYFRHLRPSPPSLLIVIHVQAAIVMQCIATTITKLAIAACRGIQVPNVGEVEVPVLPAPLLRL